MIYTNMGQSGLFLYKGRDGIIQKIDEINMEVLLLAARGSGHPRYAFCPL